MRRNTYRKIVALLAPASLKLCNDLSKVDFVPAITTWPGELKLTASKISFPCSSLHISIPYDPLSQ